MSLQKKGASLDNSVANALIEATDETVDAHSMRGSGNTKHSQCDVLLRTPKVDWAIELKRSSIGTDERTQIADEEDLHQLADCANTYTRIGFGIKLTNRQLCFVEASPIYTADTLVERLPNCFDANHTDSGNLTIRKPEASEWPSAQSGESNADVILNEVGWK